MTKTLVSRAIAVCAGLALVLCTVTSSEAASPKKPAVKPLKIVIYADTAMSVSA